MDGLMPRPPPGHGGGAWGPPPPRGWGQAPSRGGGGFGPARDHDFRGGGRDRRPDGEQRWGREEGRAAPEALRERDRSESSEESDEVERRRKRRARKHLRERRMRRAGWGGSLESGHGNGKSNSLPKPVCAPISSEEEGEL